MKSVIDFVGEKHPIALEAIVDALAMRHARRRGAYASLAESDHALSMQEERLWLAIALCMGDETPEDSFEAILNNTDEDAQASDAA